MLTTTEQRLNAIRQWLEKENIDVLIIPHEDEYLGEYIPLHNERLHWLTGFTGSAGLAIVTQYKAAIFVDGRYTVQVTKQVPSELYTYCHLIDEPPLDWLVSHLNLGDNIAIDPKVHSASWVENAQLRLNGKLNLRLLETNPIDPLWHDRPTPQVSDVRLMPIDSVGEESANKRQRIADLIREKGANSAVITALDSICWLLNIRGLDVSRLPVLLSHAIVHSNGTLEFFIDPKRLPKDFSSHVGDGVSIHIPEMLRVRLEELVGSVVLVDPKTSNAWNKLVLQNIGAQVIDSDDPCLMPKASKNATEIIGMKACHIRDGVAMSSFLCWLDNEVEQGRLHDEATLADKLLSFRQKDPKLVDLSFDTISAAGSNAAMCHYNHENQPAPGQLEMNSLYLVDSGGQYLDGTTDITRTVAIGIPSDEMIKQFTLALKGHIAVSRARFPTGTKGYQIDTLARQYLWAEGYDYDHGTGHGVGHFLNVHEGPASISKRQIDVPLTEGMVLSNEPGYYRTDGFGIRIENLELVVKQPTKGDFDVLTFESLTRCPIDVRNIDFNLLTDEELGWLNSYHQRVWDDLNLEVSDDVRPWLYKTTKAIFR